MRYTHMLYTLETGSSCPHMKPISHWAQLYSSTSNKHVNHSKYGLNPFSFSPAIPFTVIKLILSPTCSKHTPLLPPSFLPLLNLQAQIYQQW